MYLKVFCIVFFVVNYVNARIGFKHPNTAFDQELYENVLDPELCDEQISYIRSDTFLTLRFLDAGIRFPRGFLTGNMVDLGNYYQCLSIDEIRNEMEIKGKYCMIQVPFNQTLKFPEFIGSTFEDQTLLLETKIQDLYNQHDDLQSSIDALTGDIKSTIPDNPFSTVALRLAVCIPRSCSVEQAMSSGLLNLSAIGFEVNDLFCRLPDDKPWSNADYVAIYCIGLGICLPSYLMVSDDEDDGVTCLSKRYPFILVTGLIAQLVVTLPATLKVMGWIPIQYKILFSLIGLITILSTCYDLNHIFIKRQDPKQANTLYRSFSVYANGKRLTTFTSNPNSLDCLDGIRTLAMLWVIIGHQFITESFMYNFLEGIQWMLSAKALWITVAPYTVDTFFTITGLLLVYTSVGKMSGSGLLKNLHLFYLNRLLRLFPLLAVVVLLQASVLHRVFDGPYWEGIADHVQRCREHWWATLLHVQNYATPSTMCITHSWYVAIDVQLHIVSPLVLFWVLGKSRRTAWIALSATLAVVFATTTYYSTYKGFQGYNIVSNRNSDDTLDFMFNHYINTFTRSAPFFVGMGLGYIMSNCKGKQPKIHTAIVLLLWACTFTMFGLLAYSVYQVKQFTWDNPVLDVVMNTYGKSAWALALGWVIFACAYGYGGPINWFLSLDMWKLPSRLSYAMFLFHYPLQFVINATEKSPVYFSIPAFIFKIMAYIFLTFIVSFFVSLLIDAPFSVLIKVMLGNGPKKKNPPVSNPDQNIVAAKNALQPEETG